MAADAEGLGRVAVERLVLARVVVRVAVVRRVPLGGGRGLGAALWVRGVLAGGAEGGFEVLAQQGGRARGGLRVAVLAGVGGDVAGYSWREGRLVGGEDERGPLRDDLGEAGGALPAAGEGADAVDAANVGEGGEAVGDGGPPPPELARPLIVVARVDAAAEQGLVLELDAAVAERGDAPRAGEAAALVLVPGGLLVSRGGHLLADGEARRVQQGENRTEQTEALPVRLGQVRSGSGTAGVELVERREGSWSPGLGPRLILDSPGLAQGRL